MEKKHHTVLRQFNDTIDGWVGSLDNYTLDMLCQKPGAGAWSLGQVYIHIITDTGWFVDRMKDCLSGVENADKEMSEDGKAMFARNAFPDMPLTNPSTDAIRQPQSKDELAQGLRSIRAEVNGLATTFDFSTAGGKTEHPGLRWFSALEWLQFADMHMRHHLRQKKRIDATLF
jgi:hypothetical protein